MTSSEPADKTLLEPARASGRSVNSVYSDKFTPKQDTWMRQKRQAEANARDSCRSDSPTNTLPNAISCNGIGIPGPTMQAQDSPTGAGGGGCPFGYGPNVKENPYAGEYYHDYLGLDKILNAQFPASAASAAQGLHKVPSFMQESIARTRTQDGAPKTDLSSIAEVDLSKFSGVAEKNSKDGVDDMASCPHLRATQESGGSPSPGKLNGQNGSPGASKIAGSPGKLQSPGESHDEMLFIIIHQTYELWFKQIIHEFNSVYRFFEKEVVEESDVILACHRMTRITRIQEVLIQQIAILETMTPMEFLDFRDYLVPASGFQSWQFRWIEVFMGLPIAGRKYGSETYLMGVFEDKHKQKLAEMVDKPSLSDLVEKWLERLPFFKTEQYDFWQEYKGAIDAMCERDADLIRTLVPEHLQEKELRNLKTLQSSFRSLFDEEIHKEMIKRKMRKWSQKATLAALFIFLYRHEPMLSGPFRFLNLLMEIDENFCTWRLRHAAMAHRMIGLKVGTGGTSGVEYLNKCATENKVFKDIWQLSTYLIPSSALPELPPNLKTHLGFHHTAVHGNSPKGSIRSSPKESPALTSPTSSPETEMKE